ncbi:MAG: zinc-ribbon domain-containing protein [Firmicutes bacterium]|nr:zinc-ribbon domain-containing protein [Bacillota bacterium]
MALFDKITDIFNSTSKELGKKAKDVISTVKLENEITGQESKIRESFLKIGEQYFEAFKDDPDSPYAKIIAEVAEAKAKIADLRNQINDLKGLVKCPVCGEAVSADQAFCPKCGAKLPEKAVEEKVEEAVEEVKEAVEEVKEAAEDAAEEIKE